MKTLVSVLALSLALGASAANAEQVGDQNGPRHANEQSGRGMMTFYEFDANADGFVTEAELTAKAQERFTETDANGDGQLDASEIAAAHTARMERPEQAGNEDRSERMAERAERMITNMIKIADENDDDMISFEEQQAARPNSMFEKMDANEDGKISEIEWHVAADHRGDKDQRDERGPRKDR